MAEENLLSLVITFSVTILYAFTYIEVSFIVYKIFYKEKFKPSLEFASAFLFIPLLLFAVSHFAQKAGSTDYHLDLFFVSLAFFFASVVLFSLGLIVRGTWEQKVREMNIKLLSTYSLWIIQGIYLMAVIMCFLLALVSLAKYILDYIPIP
jgi:hypothetical protein